MKPNLLFVQSDNFDIDHQIEVFCENFCETHYVYLIRPGSDFREDSVAGLRFLSHSVDSLPGFVDVDTAVSIADPKTADILKAAYPASKVGILDTEDESHLPQVLVDILRPSIIQGDFGAHAHLELACAM